MGDPDILKILADDPNLTIYRPSLRQLTGSVTSAILFNQILYRWKKKKGKSFYKFKVPPKKREGETGEQYLERVKPYKEGDSWCEELGFSRSEFDNAIKKMAISEIPN